MQIYVGKTHLNGSQDNSLYKCSWAVLSEKVSRHEPALNVLLLSGCSCQVTPCFKSRCLDFFAMMDCTLELRARLCPSSRMLILSQYSIPVTEKLLRHLVCCSAINQILMASSLAHVTPKKDQSDWLTEARRELEN